MGGQPHRMWGPHCGHGFNSFTACDVRLAFQELIFCPKTQPTEPKLKVSAIACVHISIRLNHYHIQPLLSVLFVRHVPDKYRRIRLDCVKVI